MTKIQSRVEVLSSLLFSGRFEVPWHQRYYDWTPGEVTELLEDIEDALNRRRSCYFIGSIMLVKSADDGSPWIVNDGQQRLITLSLVIAALCRRFSEMGDSGNETLALRALFVRANNKISVLDNAEMYTPRIIPAQIDQMTYNQIIRGHDVGTNGKLVQAFDAVNSFVQALDVKTKRFFTFINERLEISRLAIPPNVDVNSFFESLNARGKPLDDVDLIRNRLYSYFSDVNDDARRKTVHLNLEAAAVVSRTPKTKAGYFRCYLQCRYGYLRPTRAYRDVRTMIDVTGGDNVRDHVLDLVRGLGDKQNTELFRHIVSQSDRRDFHGLFPAIVDLRRYAVSQPIMFALVHRWLNESEMNKKLIKKHVDRSLQNVTSFVMRTAFVAKFEPSHVDAIFANLARDIFVGSTIESLEVMENLREADKRGILDDRAFVRQMENVTFTDNRKALQFLYGINKHIQRGGEAIRRDECSVEHVLPQSLDHWEGWPAFALNTGRNEYVGRTGNLVILPKAENRGDREFNGSYEMKRQAFERSILEMPRRIADRFFEWTPDVIDERSRELAKLAAKTWPFRRTRSHRNNV